MQPSQPYYQPPTPTPTPPSTPGNGQYDFILGDNTPPSRNPFTTGNGLNKKLILSAVGGLVFVIVLVVLILNLAFGGKGGNAAPLINLLQKQTEIARVADAASQSDNLRVQANKDLAQAVQLSLLTDKKDMIGLLSKMGKRVTDKQLAVNAASARTDQALSAAQASGTYDSTFATLIQDQLKAYSSALNSAYRTSTSASERQLLKTQYDHAQLLLQQSGVTTEP